MFKNSVKSVLLFLQQDHPYNAHGHTQMKGLSLKYISHSPSLHHETPVHRDDGYMHLKEREKQEKVVKSL